MWREGQTLASSESSELTPLDDDSLLGDTANILKLSRKFISRGEIGESRPHPSKISPIPDKGKAMLSDI